MANICITSEAFCDFVSAVIMTCPIIQVLHIPKAKARCLFFYESGILLLLMLLLDFLRRAADSIGWS